MTVKPLTDRLAQAWASHGAWILGDVLGPFALTRLALIVTGLAAQAIPRDPTYPLAVAVQRGWQFSPVRLLDMWARWDSGWYIDIITRGYRATGPLDAVQTNLNFFPLYPYLVKALLIFAPAPTREMILAAGLCVSNIMLLLALALLRQLVIERTNDAALARRSIWALLLFPTGFFLSAFYTESTYLCFLLAAWLMATRRRWVWAAALGALTALSRPPGVLLALPLALEYLASINWQLKRVRWGILVAGGPVLGLALFLALQIPLSGDFIGPLRKTAWNQSFAWPWVSWLRPTEYADGWVTVDRLCVLAMLGVLPLIASRFKSPALLAQAVLAAFAGLFGGMLTSYTRYAAVIFPATMAIADMWKRPWVGIIIGVLMAIVQLALFAAYSQFYPVL
jgi:Gpi18-like mannosyltransferase